MLCSVVLPAGSVITTFLTTVTAVPLVFRFAGFPVCALPFTNVSVSFVLLQLIQTFKVTFATEALVWTFLQFPIMCYCALVLMLPLRFWQLPRTSKRNSVKILAPGKSKTAFFCFQEHVWKHLGIRANCKGDQIRL